MADDPNINGVFNHKVASPEFPSVADQQPQRKLGEQTGFQAIITSSWVLRWAAMPTTYATYRTIRKHPTVALARSMAVAPVLAGEWSVKAKDDAKREWVEQVQDTFMPLRDKYIEDAMFYGNIDFGYQGFEQVYENRGGYSRIVKLKALLQDITEVCIGHKGQFVGFRQWGTELGLANAVHVGFRVEGSYLYGIPLMENVRGTWQDWVECNEGAKRYDKHVAGAHWVVHYPDCTVTHNGVKRPAAEVANSILWTLESAGGVAVPRDVAEWMSQLGTNDPGWKIELLATGTNEQANFVDRLNYLDKLLCRGLLLPERSVLEGTHGTKQEAETHLDAAMANKDIEHRYITRELNRQAVDPFLVENFGEEARGKVELEASPIVDRKRDFYMDLYQQVLADPIRSAEEFQAMDLDAMRDALGIPKSKETDKRQLLGVKNPQEEDMEEVKPAGFSNVIRLDSKAPAGRWITIGGGEEGGGAHVFIDAAGRIAKGPASLKGKNVKHLAQHLPANGQKEFDLKAQRKTRADKGQPRKADRKAERHTEPVPFDVPGEHEHGHEHTNPYSPPRHKKALNPRSEAGRAIIAMAKEWEIDPEALAATAREMHGEKLEAILHREAAKAHAREMTGMNAGTISRIENNPKGGDYSSKGRNFDTIAPQIARMYPGVIGNVVDDQTGDYSSYSEGDLSAGLWDLIREGKARLPKLHDQEILQEAAKHTWHATQYAKNSPPVDPDWEFSNKPQTSNRPWRGLALANGDSPKEGDSKTVNGRNYVLREGRWHRDRDNDTPEHKPIEITGKEFGVNWSDPGLQRTMLPQLLAQFSADSPYTNRETQMPIKVNRRGFNEILHHFPDHKPAMVLAKLPEMLENMAWTHDEDQDPPKAGVKKWHYFHADVMLDGALHDAEIKVREDVNGHWFYDQHIKVT